MPVERVAVIGGTGKEGFGLALRWAAAGIYVIVGSRDGGRAEEAATRLTDLVPSAAARGVVNSEAAAASGVVVVTVPFAGQAAIYKSLVESLRPGTVVVDCTVPVAAAVGGRASRVLGVWEGSAAQQADAILAGKDVRMGAAFHSLSAAALTDLESPLDGDVLTVGGKGAKAAVRELVEAVPGLRFVDAGPLENARLVEPLTALLIGINRRYGTDRSGLRITGI
ncbi:NADPH-dependent F420 reductase [soil metagenome]